MVSNISGSTLQLQIKSKVSAQGEAYSIDNLFVTESCPAAKVNVNGTCIEGITNVFPTDRGYVVQRSTGALGVLGTGNAKAWL